MWRSVLIRIDRGETLRIILLEVLTGALIVLLPVFGAFFGYVSGAFLRLNSRSLFWLVNTGAIVLAPTVTMTPAGISPGPAGYVLARGLLAGPFWSEVVLSLLSMIALTFVNIRISKYIKR